MRLGEVVSLMMVIGALFGLTVISSKKFDEPDKEAALASAIKAEYDWFMGDDLYAKSHDPSLTLTLCLESQTPFDIDALSAKLSSTVIRPVPFSSCRREIEEGDFGMFTAIYHHFGPRGEEAAHLEVVKIECRTSSSCLVDIDGFGSGDRYFVERSGGFWKVVDTQNRWIV